MPEMPLPSSDSVPTTAQVAPKKPNRLVEIDVFRASAICLMGATHGLFWVDAAPVWAQNIAYVGILYCFTAFLVSFGMAQSISVLRGRMDRPGASVETARRALITLGAYYIVALGKYLPEMAHAGTVTAGIGAARILLLADVPKAGSFFLVFVFYTLFAAALGRRFGIPVRHPAVSMGVALVLWAAGLFLATHFASTNGYAKLVWGATSGSRTFPLLGYAPLWVLGIWAGKSYYESQNRPRLLAIWGAAGAVCVTATLLYLAPRVPDAPAFIGNTVSSLPQAWGLVGSGGLGLLCFALCGLLLQNRAADSPWLKVLVYIGQNSIWIIVWQYIWIQFAGRTLHLGNGGDARTALYALLLVVMPPVSLWITQQIGARMTGFAARSAKTEAKA